MVFNTGGTWRRVTFEKLMMKIYDFFNRLSRLVSVCNNINKKREDGRFSFILLQTETKLLSRLKKSYIFIISFSNITRCQVPPVLKTIFIFRSWTPSVCDAYNLFSSCHHQKIGLKYCSKGRIGTL